MNQAPDNYSPIKLVLTLSLLAVLLAGQATGVAHAGSLTVCASGCDFATVQEAIDAAVPGDVITVSDPVHTEAGIAVDKDVTIQGLGATNTIVQAQLDPSFVSERVFTVGDGTSATIQDMVIRHGHKVGSPGLGGGILNAGTLTLRRVEVSANLSGGQDGDDGQSAYGGGIYNRGTLVMSDSTIAGNTAFGGNATAMYGAAGDALGGGIYNAGALTIQGVVLSSNGARGGNATADSSEAGDVYGGGLYNAGALTMRDSTFSENVAQGGTAEGEESRAGDAYGGGLVQWWSSVGSVVLDSCTLVSNAARGGYAQTVGSDSGKAYGGSVAQWWSPNSTLELTNCSINGNSAEGGTGADGQLAASAEGGGLRGSNGLTLRYCTVAANEALGNESWGGGLYSFAGVSGGPSLVSTIVAGNSGPSHEHGHDLSGNVVSGDYNLIGDPEGYSLSGPAGNNIEGVDPLLEPLQDNGGTTQTQAIPRESPAIDKIPTAQNGCGITVTQDQRGIARPQEPACDVGAFELEKTGTLQVVKELVPATDPGRFDLQIDGTTRASNAADGESTDEQTIPTGVHSVGEMAGAGTLLADYRSSIECQEDGGSGRVVASGNGAGPLAVRVNEDDEIVCTIRNERKTGHLEVVKELVPDDDEGRFGLQIDGITKAANVQDGGSTGEQTVNTGAHTVGEVAAGTTSLADYRTSVECRANDSQGAVVASSSDGGTLTVTVNEDDDLVCTIRNERKTGTLELVKDLVPATDSGRFDLQIDGVVAKTDASAGDTTGRKTVKTGPHTVAEVAGTGTDLADYSSMIRCRVDGGQGDVVASGEGSGPLTVEVNEDDDIVCTVRNVGQAGKLELVKDLMPASDPGLFHLQIDGVTEKPNATDGGTTGEQIVRAGEHTVSEVAGTGTSLADYDTSIECRDNDGQGLVVATGPTSGPLAVLVNEDDDIVCTVRNVRKTGKLEVVKDLVPDSDSGLFDLQIDGVTEKAGALDGSTTGEHVVNTGSHKVGEVAAGDASLAHYRSNIECRADDGHGDVVASSAGAGPATLLVHQDDDIVCTIRNERKTGKLEIVHELAPATDPGRFHLQIDGITKAANAADGGSTGEQTVNTGERTVGEAAGTGTSLEDYHSGIECRANDGQGAVVASSSNVGPLSVSVNEDDDIVCTVRNERKTGDLEVRKEIIPSNDPGRFNLEIDGVVERADAAHGDTTGERAVNTGDRTVGESGGTETLLGDYRSSIECRAEDGQGGIVASSSDAGPLTLAVAEDDDIVCVLRNERKTGSLEVVKALVPDDDPGRFVLQIDGVIQKGDVSDGDSTGKQTVNTGTYTIREFADSGTALGNYWTDIECRTGGGDGDLVATSTYAGPLPVVVNENDDIVCSVRNQRKTGSLEVVKALVPDTDAGRFHLQIDGVTEKLNATHGDSTGEQIVNTGTYTVREAAGADTTLDDYRSSIECRDSGGQGEVVASGQGVGPLTVAVGADDAILCTVRNERKSGTLEVVKVLVPDSDPGRFHLQINGAIKKEDASSGDTTGEQTVYTGVHMIGESAGSATVLEDYRSSIECRSENGHGDLVANSSGTGPLAVTVNEDDDIVCVVRNERKTGSLEVVKALVPVADTGRFHLQIDGATKKTDATDGDSTGQHTVNTGSHSVGETAGTDTILEHYRSNIECRSAGGHGEVVAEADGSGPLSVLIDEDVDVVCTIYNERKTGKLEVFKDLVPDTDPGRFHLQIDDVTVGENRSDGESTGEQTVNTGLHTISEAAGTGTTLDDYWSSIECRDKDGQGEVVSSSQDTGILTVVVNEDDDLVCTVRNERKTGTLEVIKDLVPSTDPGRFHLQIDGVTEAADALDDESTGEQTVNTGLHTVGEMAGTGTTLDDYWSSIECRDENGRGEVVASRQDAGILTVEIGENADILCTVRNERKTGTLQIIKELVPESDPGQFNLQIDGATVGIPAGHGDSTGEQEVNTGTRLVGETAVQGTLLENYRSSIECRDENGQGDLVASGEGPGPLAIDVGEADEIVCEIRNERRTGKLEVVKELVPDTDPGRFNLQIDGATIKTGAAHGDSTGEQLVNIGPHAVGEAAGTGTVLTDYQSSIECRNDDGAGSVVARRMGAGPLTVVVNEGDDIVCAVRNERKTGSLQVIKALVPDTDPGRFHLTIDGVTEKASASHGDSTGKLTVNTGEHTVGESAKTGTLLTDYVSSIECRADDGQGEVVATSVDVGPLAVMVNENDDIVCTVSNERKTGLLEVVKVLAPDSDPGRFHLQIDGITEKSDAGGGDTTGKIEIQTGTHFVSEIAAEDTPLADYSTAIQCRGGGGDGPIVASSEDAGPLDLVVGEDEDIVCTVSNVRHGRIIVEKQTQPDGEAATFVFAGEVSASLKDGQTVDAEVEPGTYSVQEASVAGWDLTGIECDDTDSTGDVPRRMASFHVAPGEVVKCTFTNTKWGQIVIEKQTHPDEDPTSFVFSGDASGSLKDGQTTMVPVAPGTYAVREMVPADWDLTVIICDDEDSSGEVAAGAATLHVSPGETVKCTFSNTKRGKIIIENQTQPAGDPAEFSFGGALTGALKDGQSLTLEIEPGIHRVQETVPGGWDLAGIECDDGDSSGDIATATATLNVAPGETVKCTFTNVRRGTVVIRKDARPDGSQSFAFTGDLGSFSISDDGLNPNDRVFPDLVPGHYDVVERVPAAWQLTDVDCLDPDQGTTVSLEEASASIDLDPGEQILCTFQNTQRGAIVVEKVTRPPGAAGPFTFSGDAAGSISGGEAIVVPGLQPGTYSSHEALPQHWRISSIWCDDDDSTGNIDAGMATFRLQAGEVIQCTFENAGLADLAIATVAGPSVITQRQPVTYTLAFTNLQGIPVPGVTVTDTVPAALTDVHFESKYPVIPVDSSRFAIDVGWLAPGEYGQITVTGVISAELVSVLALPESILMGGDVIEPGVANQLALTNTALIGGDVIDLNPGNNEASAVVMAVNHPPHVEDDTYSTPQNSALTSAPRSLLDNDRDPDGHSLLAVLVSGPADGIVALRLDGTFVYTPTLDFMGLDSFAYQASDGVLDSKVARVAIDVTAPIHATYLPVVVRRHP